MSDIYGFKEDKCKVPIGTIVHYYNNVEQMKNDDRLEAEDVVQTLGYYEANDGGAGLYKIVDDDMLVDDGGSIHDLENGLKAELIIKDFVNVKQFGAKGDGNYDDSGVIQTAIDYAYKTNDAVFIPKGTFIIRNQLELHEKSNIRGAGKYISILKDDINEEKNIPLITTDNQEEKDKAISNIKMSNFTLTSNGIRSVYDIELYNISYSEIHDIYFNRLNIISNNEQDLHGILIERDNDCGTESVVNKIYNNTIRNGKIKLKHTTDNYIDKNELWAPNCQDCALEFNYSTNNSITNNQIVGGFVYGGIYFSHNQNSPIISGNKIVNNYFDGSYSAVHSANAIYIGTNVENMLVNDNLFYKTKKSVIVQNANYSSKRMTINGNMFQDGNIEDNSYSDIVLVNAQNESINITNNQFYNNNKTNKGYPIELVCTSNNAISKSIISNNTVEYPSGYLKYNYDKKYIILKNNSENLGIDNNADYLNVQQTSSQSFTQNGLLNLTDVITSKGTGLNLSNNQVVVNSNSGINELNINANILCYGTIGKKTICITKNNNIVAQQQFYNPANLQNFSLQINTNVAVTEGDSIAIQINADNDNTVTTIGTSATNFVNIKAIG